MEKYFYVISGLLIVLIVLFGALVINNISQTNTNNDLQKIIVQGQAEKKVMPDKAEVYFTIETEASTAEKAQKLNKETFQKIKSHLANYKYETLNYNLRKNKVWDSNKRAYIVKGYKVINSIKIITEDIENVGKIIDFLTNNNININYISFGLTKETEEKIKAELWAEAVKKAQSKAETIVSATGAKLNKTPVKIEINSYRYYPIMKAMATDMAPQNEEIETEISPKEIDVSVSLTLTYQYS